MRYFLATLFVCAFAIPTAFALPTLRPASPFWAKADPIVQVAKHTKPSAHRHSHGNGGIHPLVGSGDY
ncbi:hypothetical protein [Rhodoblastus sp.]|uniref:hypothetical protein n=1 Tax=Rhodoblastus sp. TaxID=1962975 RepID=UPI003F97C87A